LSPRKHENARPQRNSELTNGFSPHQSLIREKTMLAKYITTGLVGSLMLASAAFAQTPTATSDRANTAATSSSSFQGDWRASKMAGLNVYNDKNENVGSINDLLMDKSGNIKAAVISVGGFLGVGSRYVAVPFDKVKFSDEPVAYTSASNAPAGTAPAGNRPASTTTTGSATTPPAASSASSAPKWYPDHAVFNATKDELQAMPEFKYNE
jgi:sporulation protein YlmC with PRC-barrel domain